MTSEIELAAARQSYEAFMGVVRRMTQRLTGATTRPDVERVVAEIGSPELSLGLLGLAVADESLGPAELLVSSLVFRRTVKGSAFEEGWSAVFGHEASRAAYELRLPGLLELRLTLLDDLIAHPHPAISLAQLHFERANTRRAITVNDRRAMQSVLDDLRLALELAPKEENGHIYAVATATLVQVVAAMDRVRPELAATLEKQLAQVLALWLPAHDRALLHQARSRLARSIGEDASRSLEDALALVPPSDPFRTELAAELVSVLVTMGRTEEAVARGLAFLAEPACQGHGVLLGMLHLSVGQALGKSQRMREAREQLVAGLELVRGRDRHNEVMARLFLASAGISERDRTLVDEQLRILGDRWDELDGLQRSDVVDLRAAAAAAWEDAAAERAALDAGALLARGEPKATQLRLRRALVDLSSRGSIDELDALLMHALDLPPDEEIESLVQRIAADHAHSIVAQTREQVRGWAQRRRFPSMEARMLHHEGRTQEAIAALRLALGREVTPVERIRCVHLLVALLGPEDISERRERCRELEALLEQVGGQPHVRLDLAVGMRMSADGDIDLLRRARAHALRALADVRDPHILAHGHGVLAQLAVDLAAAALPASTADAAEAASWLAADRSMPVDELDSFRLAAVRRLLVPGPLTHPRALEVARSLLRRVRGNPAGSTERDALDQRLTWLDDRVAGQGVPREPKDGPFDDVPSWLIALVAGRGPGPSGAEPGAGAAIELALAARPDADERLRAAQRTVLVDSERSRAIACFEQGVEAMRGVQRDLLDPDAAAKITKARLLLGEAVELTRSQRLPERFDFLVSLGNAWKTPPAADLEQALRIYDEAALLDAIPAQRAKLWKVTADALYKRGGADDLRRAGTLLAQALEIRRDGWLRVETLCLAAQVARRHPDLDDAEREIQAAEYFMAAVRADHDHASEALRLLVDCLTAWTRHRPDDQRPARYRDELRTIYPHRTIEIGAQASLKGTEGIIDALEHPAARAFLAVRFRLMPPGERRADPHGLLESLGPRAQQRLEEQAVRTSLLGRPDEAERELAILAAADDPATRPGIAVVEVLLLALLARAGRRSPAEVRARTDAALVEASTVGVRSVQALFLRELACVWSPNSHDDKDPVQDFALAAGLLRQVVALEGGETAAHDDTLAFLARALRYASGDGDLRESRRLYRVVLARARAQGDPDLLANILHNLAEIETQVGEGGRLERLVHAESLLEEATRIARAPERRMIYLAGLAWHRTQIGMLVNGAGGLEWLERAKATFALVTGAQLEPGARRAFESNRATCDALLEERAGRRQPAIDRYRARLAEVAISGTPHTIATAQHNLASVLMFGDQVNAAELREGLLLARAAAAVRTIELNARHHWETAFDVGRMIAAQLDAGRADSLLLSSRDAWIEARQWFRQAVAAARALGPGEELAEAGFAMSHLTTHAVSADEATATAEESWQPVHEAMAFLLTEPALREREARHALRVAFQLAARLAADAVAVASPGITFALVDDRAEIVQRWLLRAQLPTRRPSRARLAHPDGASPLTWVNWRAVLDTADPRRIAASLARVREEAPTFLSEDGDISSAAHWLEARPGSAAIAAFLAEAFALAWLMTVDERGRRRTWIVGLEASPPPVHSVEMGTRMSNALQGPSGLQAQVAMGAWARRHLAEPLERMLGRPPTAVLWCPGPGLRLIAPAAIWTSSPVAATSAIEGPERRTYPQRRRSTLIALADPGPGASSQALGEHGRRALDRLAAAAESRGPVRRMGSAGRRFGRALLGHDAGVRDTPVSPRDLLAEAAEHDVVVVIAHGELTAGGDAAMVCVDREGALVRLTDDMLAGSPEALAGSTVVLLTCSAGQVTSMLADPGGLAGTLLSAGARCVVAPMWPVRIDAAAHVAELVLRGSTLGQDPWQVLTYVQHPIVDGGPPLGGPPASMEDRRARDAVQHLAFIAWVG